MSTKPFPVLERGNAAVMQLRAWLVGERERIRETLETAPDLLTIQRLQGRATLLSELLRLVDETHRAYGDEPLKRD